MYIDLGRQPHNEFSMEWYAVQVPWNYRYDDDSCARFGESNAFSLYRVGFAGIRNGEIRHGGLLADVHATIDKHAFETFSTSERVVRKMSRQKKKKRKKRRKGRRKTIVCIKKHLHRGRRRKPRNVKKKKNGGTRPEPGWEGEGELFISWLFTLVKFPGKIEMDSLVRAHRWNRRGGGFVVRPRSR